MGIGIHVTMSTISSMVSSLKDVCMCVSVCVVSLCSVYVRAHVHMP